MLPWRCQHQFRGRPSNRCSFEKSVFFKSKMINQDVRNETHYTLRRKKWKINKKTFGLGMHGRNREIRTSKTFFWTLSYLRKSVSVSIISKYHEDTYQLETNKTSF